MKNSVPVLLFQNLLQSVAETDDGVCPLARAGIGKGFLGMGVVDQDLRALGALRKR